jgi:hypothetical protein
MSNLYPHELQFGAVYITPVIVVLALSFFATLIVAFVLNKTKLAKYFYFPNYIFLAIMVIFTILIDRYFIRF